MTSSTSSEARSDPDDGDRPVAVVLGASGGIGTAVVGALAARGYAVVAHRRSGAVATGGPAPALVLDADLTDPAAADGLARAAVADLGPPDLVVHCAGHRHDGLFVTQRPEAWLDDVSRDLAIAQHPIRAFLPWMLRRRQGSVVVVASVAAFGGLPGQTAYAAAKAGIVAMVKVLAREYGSRNLRFNAVAPGFVATAMTEDVPEEVRAAIAARQALPGEVRPEDVAGAVCYLAEADSVTGQVLVVDRGLQ